MMGNRSRLRRAATTARRTSIQVEDIDHALSRLPRTDLANVDRFLRRFGDEFCWQPGVGWMVLRDGSWTAEGAADRVAIAVHVTVRAIQDEAAQLYAMRPRSTCDAIDRRFQQVWRSAANRLQAWGYKSEMHSRMRTVETLARAYLTCPSLRSAAGRNS